MKRRIRGAVSCILCVCVMLCAAACGRRTDVKAGDTYIYCLNGDRTGLTKVSCKFSKEDTKAAVEQVLKGLAEPAEDIDYSAALPEKVQVNSYRIKQMVLYVDFNGAYGKLPSVEEKLVRAALVKSLLQIHGIRGIWITVDGEDLKRSDGQPAGILNEDDFVQNTGSSLSSYEKTTLTLYFANEEGDRLVEKTMDVRYSSNVSREKLIVEKLMKGPKANGKAFPTLNPNVTLLGVTVKEGICYVNFDSEFLNSVYDVKPEIVIYSIVNSLVEGSPASKVQITVNGEKSVKYMDTVDLSQQFQRDLELVEQ